MSKEHSDLIISLIDSTLIIVEIEFNEPWSQFIAGELTTLQPTFLAGLRFHTDGAVYFRTTWSPSTSGASHSTGRPPRYCRHLCCILLKTAAVADRLLGDYNLALPVALPASGPAAPAGGGARSERPAKPCAIECQLGPMAHEPNCSEQVAIQSPTPI